MNDNQAFVSISNDVILKVSAQSIKGMFKFITRTANPLGGQCPHNCIYCWRHDLVRRFTKLQNKYLGKPKIDFKQLKPFKNEKDLIFLCTMTDLFAINVPDHIITTILNFVENNEATFLLQTKNPKRFQDFLTKIPANTILGSTIESNRHYPQISKAPPQKQRLHWMAQLAKKTNLPLFVAIEPILDFDIKLFVSELQKIRPKMVVVGYDNYNHHMPEPCLEKTLQLIEHLEKFTEVETKTLRQKWNHIEERV